MKVAVVGATGLVGTRMIQLLEQRNFPVTTFIPVASEKSVGRKVSFKGKDYAILTPAEAVSLKADLALFSAGGQTSIEWAPLFAAEGTTVIDNSSAWRMDPGKKLIVPEVNGHVLTASDKIIANPNCSTIQMVLVLKPLHDRYKIKRVVVSTYQSVSGTGAKAIEQLMAERNQQPANRVYPHPIDLNILPQIDVFQDNGYTKEEMKMVKETCKIMGDDSIRVTATAVRVPVIGGHSESVNIEFEKDFELTSLRQLLSDSPGIIVQDDPSKAFYPMPLYAEGNDEVFVGRIRRDETQANTLNCWIVADNLRKGAATNAIQIAELLIKNKFIGL
jgi:aspartate-semialdehyde dehydrogenase